MMATYVYSLWVLLEYPDISIFFLAKRKCSISLLCKNHIWINPPCKAKIHELSGFV